MKYILDMIIGVTFIILMGCEPLTLKAFAGQLIGMTFAAAYLLWRNMRDE